MSNLQTTIKGSITLKGVGIHTGKDVSLTFKPAEEDVGYVFSRTDLPNKPLIRALSEYVSETQRGTTLEKDGVKLKTTEHVLAALVGLEIDNIIIEIDGEEPPIMDGSSKFFVNALEEVGIVQQSKLRSEFIIKDVINFRDDETGSEITLIPADNYQVTTMVDYETKVLGTQNATLNNLKEFKSDFANARTFSFLHEIEMLLENDLIKGGDLKYDCPVKNIVITYELKAIIYNKDDFRFAAKQAQKVSPECHLYLQPEWSRRDSVMPLMVDYVLQNTQWRVSLQTHKYLNIPMY